MENKISNVRFFLNHPLVCVSELGTGKEKCISEMGTGKEIGSQIWGPEKKMYPKSGSQKIIISPNRITFTSLLCLQALLSKDDLKT